MLDTMRPIVARTPSTASWWPDYVATMYLATHAHERGDAATFDAAVEWFNTPPWDRTDGGYTAAAILGEDEGVPSEIEPVFAYPTTSGQTAYRVTGTDEAVLVTPNPDGWQVTDLGGSTVHAQHTPGDDGPEAALAAALRTAIDRTAAPVPSDYTTPTTRTLEQQAETQPDPVQPEQDGMVRVDATTERAERAAAPDEDTPPATPQPAPSDTLIEAQPDSQPTAEPEPVSDAADGPDAAPTESATVTTTSAGRIQIASMEDLAPSGQRARAQANLAALDVLRALQADQRPATDDERRALARWSAWGALPQIFDEEKNDWAELRDQLKTALSDDEYAAARRTTINAHYTDPAYVQPMWDALDRLGFETGRVLEPGSGIGTFIAMAPPGAQMTGVELDPVTAAMSDALHPQADIRAESFAATRLPAGHFDAAIGNVPFADVTLHDPVHNRSHHAMHNHFIIKSLNLMRPGGIAAFLTSRYTMDATNPAARREMNSLADLVGAVRLPTGAHRRAAGTEVVTDLLILRRREPGEPARDDLWESVTAHQVGEEIVRTNSYFHEHPELVLGDYAVGQGMHNAVTLHVRGNLETVGADLNDALGVITARAIANGQTQTERPADLQIPTGKVAEAGAGLWEGHITATDDGTFTALHAGIHEPLTVPRTQAAELRELLRLRDQARSLLAMEAATAEDTPAIDAARESLANTYATYQAAHGPLNRYTTRSTGKTNPVTGEETTARVVPPVMRALRTDPFAALVLALENFDDATGTATPAALLTRRVVVPRTPVLGADTPDEALAISIEQNGRVDLEHIAYLLGTSPDDARQQLGTLVYEDPADDGRVVAAAEYLSGNIADKLDAARAAAEQDDAYAVNVAALERTLPTPLGMDEVEPRIGAVWITAGDHAQFLSELVDAPVKVHHPGGNMWEVDGARSGVKATSEWGTEECDAGKIFQHVLEQKPIRVMSEVEKGRYVLNPTATDAAREKAQAMQERFAEWVWEEPERAERLLADYNRRFNSLVLRDYTAEGERLTLPGLVEGFTPRPHQRTAVARMIAEPAVGLFHEVGAGKTAEMVIGAMELKRLGMVSKPAVVIPNHMLEQFSREWLQLYPQARILAASSKDLAGDKRRLFVARAATGDWDAIVMTRGAFERIPVAPDAEKAYIESQVDEMRVMLDAAQGSGARLSVKKLEKAISRHEERLAERLDGAVDPGITFEETGIDYLIVDEAHEYKNLATVSQIPDAAIEGSKRASDLHMKLEHLRSTHGERVATLATATPIANSVTEAHVMQRYLRPDLLEAAGVREFDRWAATFGQTATEIEMGIAGGYKMKTRFAKFQNVPEMLKMWHVFADVKTAEDLKLPTPDLAVRPDGLRGVQNSVLEPSEELLDFISHLADRADDIQARAVRPDEDNMLAVSSDGRKAALDMRMVGRGRIAGNKVEAAATKIAAIWRDNADNVYTDPSSGQPSAVTGALQIVFCDLGTPREGEWSVYEELRNQLVQHGMPRESIRFIHEAKNDAQKGQLFAACRSGEVSVIVGSTQKMGVGTNIQNRAVALHHLDCPWRPADVQQRDGRILRQGNQNPEVAIHRWVVEKSFDAYSWQTVERKAKFIAQIMRGKFDVREIEDIGDAAMSFAEVKALASGDPLIIEKEQATNEVGRLERLERAHHRNLVTVQRTLKEANHQLDRAHAKLPLLQAAVDKKISTAGDAFTATLPGIGTTTSRTEAGEALHAWITSKSTTINGHRATDLEDAPLGTAAELGGHTIVAAAVPRNITRDGVPTIRFTIDGVPDSAWKVPLDTVQPGPGLIRQFENHLDRMDQTLANVAASIPAHERTIEQATEALTRPFKHSEALRDARARLDEIELKMNPPQPDPDPASSDGDGNVNPAQQSDVDPALLEESRRLRQITNPVMPGSGQTTVHARPNTAKPTVGGTDRDADAGR